MTIKFLKYDLFNLKCAVNATYIWIFKTLYCYKGKRSHYLYELPSWNGNILDFSVWSQLCSALWNPMDCSLPGSCIHRLFQERILDCAAISFSRGPSNPGVKLMSPALAGRFFTTAPPGKPQYSLKTKIYRILTRGQGCLLEHCLQKPKNGKQCKQCY